MSPRRRRLLVVATLLLTPVIAIPTVHAAGTITAPADVVRQTADRGERYSTSPSSPTAPTSPSAKIGREVVDLVNAARSSRGLPRLAWDGTIARAAHAHSADMAANNKMSHVGSDGAELSERLARFGIRPSAWGEALGAGYSDAAGVVAAWIASPPHAAILFGGYTRAGAALVRSASGTTYWALMQAR